MKDGESPREVVEDCINDFLFLKEETKKKEEPDEN